MSEKFDAIVKKLEEKTESFLDEIMTNPVKAGIKILIILWIVKQGKKLVRDIR